MAAKKSNKKVRTTNGYKKKDYDFNHLPSPATPRNNDKVLEKWINTNFNNDNTYPSLQTAQGYLTALKDSKKSFSFDVFSFSDGLIFFKEYETKFKNTKVFQNANKSHNYSAAYAMYRDYLKDKFELGKLKASATAATTMPPSSTSTASSATSTESLYERNIIWFGAPGTGKSHDLNLEKDNFLKDTPNNFKRVTFYPDYRYGNFVGSYKPVSYKDAAGIDRIKYDFVPGPFLSIYVEAMKDSGHNYVLIIEEINRANVAAVFGDVFQLLDRDSNGLSEYPINPSEEIKAYLKEKLKSGTNVEEIRIPANMYIWATMNSADQGVYPMDTAFKRRWSFKYIPIDNGKDHMKDCKFDVNGSTIVWNDIRDNINKYLASKNINEDKFLGAHFMSRSDFTNDTKAIKAFKNKVIMYLYEDAAKQYRRELFDNKTYSQIISAFDTDGENIFHF